MGPSLYLYLPVHLTVLESVVKTHQEDFNTLLQDSFTEDELLILENKLDSIAAVYVQPILSELQFSDFYPDPEYIDEQRDFFEKCKSSIVLDNLPFYESNPFQVTYILELLKRFDEVLIDRGGMYSLSFKSSFLVELAKFKTIDALISVKPVKKVEYKTTSLPVDPIDFLILDVYKELKRLSGKVLSLEELSPKVTKIYNVMKDDRLDSTSLLHKTGLNAKDFDDGLERLKFWLRKH